jgi:hypothetical protein
MRRLIIPILPLLLAVIGCNHIAGPVASRHQDSAEALGPDGRPYSIDEQESRGRQRYTIPDNNFRVGPNIGFDRVDPIPRGYQN